MDGVNGRAGGPVERIVDVTSELDAAMAAVGDRWTLLVVDALLDGPRRFSELQEAIPRVAPNVLTARLRRLEEQGLVVGVPLLGPPAALGVPRHRGGAGPRRGAAPAQPVGGTRRRAARSRAPPPLVRHPPRGSLVLPHLRPRVTEHADDDLRWV